MTVCYEEIPPLRPSSRWSVVEREALTDKQCMCSYFLGSTEWKSQCVFKRLCSCGCFSWANQNIPGVQDLGCSILTGISGELHFLWDTVFPACCSPRWCHCCHQLQNLLLCSSLKVAVSLHAGRAQNRERPDRDDPAQKAIWECCGMKEILYPNEYYWTGN